MKHLLLLLRVSCSLWAITICAGQSTMLKQDFPKQGVSLILPMDTTYDRELRTLGFSGPAVARLRPLSVLVRNTSQRTVIAFGIRWEKRNLQSGSVAPSDVSGSQCFGLLDGNHPHFDGPMVGTIPPGTSRLVTVAGMINTPRDLDEPLPDLSGWTLEKVELDAVVFDDGEAIGPDRLDVVKRLKARVDALQDLTQEISGKVSQGGPLHDVLGELGSAAPSQAELSSLSPFNHIDVYKLVRQQYLEELSTTAKNAGEEVALRRLKQLMYATRPTIRLVESGGK